MKTYKLFILPIILIFLGASAQAAGTASSWAAESIKTAYMSGIIPQEQYTGDYTMPITRNEIAVLIANAYENVTGTEYKSTASPFTDASGTHIAAVYELGIMSGRGENIFSPYDYTTRQEMAKIILSFKAAAEKTELILPKSYDAVFTDFSEISDWAKPYVIKATAENIINGYDDGSFLPSNTVSYEQAIALITRAVTLNQYKQPVIYDLHATIPSYTKSGTVQIKWDRLPDVPLYTIKVTEKRLSYYENDIAPNNTLTYEIQYEDFLNIDVNPNRKYTIEILAANHYYTGDIYVEEINNEYAAEISANYPQTKEAAEALMTTVSVPVWKMKGKEKVSSTITLTVHNKIAEKIKLVFEEIYNGPEKFPIKDAGAYNWRGGRSEHNGGTAIDINANENYCIYSNGTTVGNYWKPYEDPYSITPYGDVVRAFEKYGFTWGGDAWSSPKDYMHFSYLGT